MNRKELDLLGGESATGAGNTTNKANASKVFSFALPKNYQDNEDLE
jgi:hypothetical protein